jgi:hypothetical protein
MLQQYELLFSYLLWSVSSGKLLFHPATTCPQTLGRKSFTVKEAVKSPRWEAAVRRGLVWFNGRKYKQTNHAPPRLSYPQAEG